MPLFRCWSLQLRSLTDTLTRYSSLTPHGPYPDPFALPTVAVCCTASTPGNQGAASTYTVVAVLSGGDGHVGPLLAHCTCTCPYAEMGNAGTLGLPGAPSSTGGAHLVSNPK